MPGPVTVGSLRRDGERIEVRCTACQRSVDMPAADIPKPDDFPFPKLQNVFACNDCGASNRKKPGSILVWIGGRGQPHAAETEQPE